MLFYPQAPLAWEVQMRICLRRREFIAGLGGAAAWPVVANAQQGDRVRRIGVLIALDENDPVVKTYVSAFTQALADLGWTDGRNVRMDLPYMDCKKPNEIADFFDTENSTS